MFGALDVFLLPPICNALLILQCLVGELNGFWHASCAALDEFCDALAAALDVFCDALVAVLDVFCDALIAALTKSETDGGKGLTALIRAAGGVVSPSCRSHPHQIKLHRAPASDLSVPVCSLSSSILQQ